MGFLDSCIKAERIIDFHVDMQCVERTVGSNRSFFGLGSVIYKNIFCFTARNDVTRRDEELYMYI